MKLSILQISTLIFAIASISVLSCTSSSNDGTERDTVSTVDDTTTDIDVVTSVDRLFIIGFGVFGAFCISLFWFIKFSRLKKEKVAPPKVYRIKFDNEYNT